VTARVTVLVPLAFLSTDEIFDLENHFLRLGGGKILAVHPGDLCQLRDGSTAASIQFEFADDETAVWFKLAWPVVA